MARQILLTTQISVENIRTGRRPNVVWIGILGQSDGGVNIKIFGETALPKEVTEAKYQNTNAGELDYIGEAGIKSLHQLGEHGS